MAKDECKCEACPEWPLSMADMMTNLLCFFVLLVSIANFDESKFEEAVKAMGETFGGQVSQATVTERHLVQFDKEQSIQGIKEALRALFRKKEKIYTVASKDKGLLITIPTKNIFKYKKSEFNSRAQYILERIAIIMDQIRFPVRIEGHTDDSPPKAKKYPTNWELTVAQSSAIGRFFIEHGMPTKSLTVMAYADTRPLVDPEIAKAKPNEKQKNQRIEIFISSLVPEETNTAKK
ncbi:flagellar motor protein MotB [Candidatus Magnetomorum sp. HK-1]|nr:flagellar motor protein MotB [Candidatus Magnetomorum sp. HK-1]